MYLYIYWERRSVPIRRSTVTGSAAQTCRIFILVIIMVIIVVDIVVMIIKYYYTYYYYSPRHNILFDTGN